MTKALFLIAAIIAIIIASFSIHPGLGVIILAGMVIGFVVG